MSEEANGAHLQEKIKVTKRKQRGADVIMSSGIFSIALDLALTLVTPDLVNISNRVFLVILGTIFVVRGTTIHENARRHH